MRRTLLQVVSVLALSALGAAACSDGPTNGITPGEPEAELGLSLNLSGTAVNTLVVQVTAADITAPLVFNIPVSNGTASGSVKVPPGLARTITVRAYDERAVLTHEGSKTVDVRGGANVTVAITLVPRAGDVPVSVTVGSLVVSATRVGTAPTGGDEISDVIRLQGTVKQPDGQAVAGASVRWASLNPAIASVNETTGEVTARAPGTTDIVATYAGYGASVSITVRTDGTNGTPDRTSPRITGFTVSPATADMTNGSRDVTFTLQATDAGSGLYALAVQLRSPDGATTRECSNYNGSATGSTTPATISCTINLSDYSKAGKWTIADLGYSDRQNNGRNLTAEQLAAAGYADGVTVVNPKVDAAAPILQAVYFTPTTIQAPTSGDVIVTLRFEVHDALSGVAKVEATGSSTADPLTHGSFSFGGGNAREVAPGLYESYILIDSRIPTGDVVLTSVRLTDRAENTVFIDAAQLAAMGMSAKFTVTR